MKSITAAILNSIGILLIVWEDAIKAFELIGVVEGKEIMDESVRRFGTKPSFDREERHNMLDKISREL